MIRKPPSTSLWDMIPIGLSHQNSEAFMGNRFQFKGDFYKNVFTLAILLAIHMKKKNWITAYTGRKRCKCQHILAVGVIFFCGSEFSLLTFTNLNCPPLYVRR